MSLDGYANVPYVPHEHLEGKRCAESAAYMKEFGEQSALLALADAPSCEELVAAP
jgi:hypothetical protein